MNAAEIKLDLLKKIKTMSVQQLREFYGMLNNYFNSSDDEWNSMTAQQKEKIEKGIAQADTGATKSLNAVTTRLKQKYGLIKP